MVLEFCIVELSNGVFHVISSEEEREKKRETDRQTDRQTDRRGRTRMMIK